MVAGSSTAARYLFGNYGVPHSSLALGVCFIINILTQRWVALQSHVLPMISRVILILRIKILPSIAQSETKMEKVVLAIRSALSFCALPDGSLEKALHSSTRIINIFQESWIRRIKFPKHSIYKLKKHLFIQLSIIFFCPSTQALTVFRCNEYPDLFLNSLLSVRKTYIQEIYSAKVQWAPTMCHQWICLNNVPYLSQGGSFCGLCFKG